MSEIKITSPCEKCENKIKTVNKIHFSHEFIELILECNHSVVIKSEPPRSRFGLDKDNENVINAAVAFIEQLNCFNSFLHPEVLKRAKELQNAVAHYWQRGYCEDERERAFGAPNANEFAEWLKTQPTQPWKCWFCGNQSISDLDKICDWNHPRINPKAYRGALMGVDDNTNLRIKLVNRHEMGIYLAVHWTDKDKHYWMEFPLSIMGAPP